MTMRDYSYLSDHIDVRGVDYWVETVREETLGLSIDAWNDPDNVRLGTRTVEVAWANLAAALWIMSEGAIVEFNGTMGELSFYHRIAAKTLLAGPTWAAEEADADTDTWDVALQLAVLGRVLYS